MPALDEEVDGLLVRSNDAGKAADLGGHVGHGGALIHAQCFNGFAGILNDLSERLAAANVFQR